jgi:hypothetical protein
MSKPKGGLQKKVSSIFSGVPLESEVVRNDVRRTEAPAPGTPTGQLAAPKPATMPAGPSAPVSEILVPKTASPVEQPAWPKVPATQPDPMKPRFEPKPRTPLSSTLAAGTSATAAPRGPSFRTETARPGQGPTDRLAAPKTAPRVIVKQTSLSNDRQKTFMLLGGLAFVLVVAVLWAAWILLGGSGVAPQPVVNQQAAIVKLAKIDWQKPSAPPASRNPMRLGSFSSSASGSSQRSNPGDPAAVFTVTAIYWTQDKVAALIDGRYVRVGETCRGAKITDITRDYVEYELNGAKAREYVKSNRGNMAGSTDVKPDANSRTN